MQFWRLVESALLRMAPERNVCVITHMSGNARRRAPDSDHPVDYHLPDVVSAAPEAELRCALVASALDNDCDEGRRAARTLAIRSDDTDAVWAAVLALEATPTLSDILVLRRDGGVVSVRALHAALTRLGGGVPVEYVVAAIKALGDDYCPGIYMFSATRLCDILASYVCSGTGMSDEGDGSWWTSV